MQKKLSPAKKRLLYALLGSSLFWHLPAASAEEAEQPASSLQQPAGEAVAADPAGSELEVQTVEVTAVRIQAVPPAYAGGQVARGAALGALGNKDFLDTPFNITSYTDQAIQDQQANTLYDVLINDSSVRFTTPAGQANENYKIRGLDVSYEHLYFNGMQGLAPHHRVPVEFLERVEVLKGPGTLLYGGVNASVGGAVNLVPKRAGEEDSTSFTTGYSSSSHFGGHIDISRRFGSNKEWGLRFNGLYADGDTETDGQSRERLLGALGLDYRGDKWRLSLDAYGSQENYDNGMISMYDLSSYGYVKAPDGSTNMYKGTSGSVRNNGYMFKGEHDLRDNLTAYAAFGQLSVNTTGFINGNHVGKIQPDGSAYLRNIFKQNFWTDTTSAELGLRGDNRTGSVRHQWVVSANRLDSDYSSSYNSLYNPRTDDYQRLPTNIYHPLPVGDYFDSVAWKGKAGKTNTTELSSLLLADTLSFDEEKVQLTLGLRRQNVKTRNLNGVTGAEIASHDADKTLPLFGFVVKPWGESVSLYGNYVKVLSPGDLVNPSLGYTNSGQIMAPYTSNQKELGVKWDQGKFAHTLSVFEIERPNSMVVTNSLDEKTQTYDGLQENRGVEWNMFGEMRDNLRLLGGITYMRGKLERTTGGAANGHTPFGVPEWTMNAGVEWDTPWDEDLTLSLRAVYTGSQYLNNANTIKLPSWVRYDIGARYKSKINDIPVTYRLSVENLFNKNYWAGAFSVENYATLGGPRTVKLSATMQF
ncbi:MAG: TonB-dependent siderophore receptor [Sporomusaceae bacterium]|nr:TonB-dependent siderophore receptor [Sporomusaceae bacterium]